MFKKRLLPHMATSQGNNIEMSYLLFIPPLPPGSNPRGTQNNEICQMDMFHFVEFGKLKCFQWATARSLEKADLVITIC